MSHSLPISQESYGISTKSPTFFKTIPTNFNIKKHQNHQYFKTYLTELAT